MNCQNMSEFILHEGMSGSHFGDVRVKDVPQSCAKKSGLLTMLIHENTREVKQILPENSIRIYLRITITLQNHMSTEKFYQYLHKKHFLRHL